MVSTNWFIFCQYDKLYADVELWLENGWLDYLAPQLYWQIDPPAQAFKVLHQYWLNQNPKARHIWPGLYTSRIDSTEKSWSAEEILNQVSATREQPNTGHIHFSMVALMQNRKELTQRLQTEKYQSTALVPESPWLARKKIAAPEIDLSTLSNIAQTANDRRFVEVKNSAGANGRLLAIWKRFDRQWVFSVQTITQSKISLADDAQWGNVKQVVISIIDRTGQESKRISFTL